jgi:hypothetical protein
MTSPFLRSIRRTLGAAAGIASLLGPAVAQALPDCIDFDGNRTCADHGDSKVPDVHGSPVDTSTGTYHAPPSPPADDHKDRDSKKDEPPTPKTPDRKYVRH